MVQSMTGYGRAMKRTSLGHVTVELRSTNHRYLEIDQRLPNGMTSLQSRLTALVRTHVRRGRIEVAIALQLHGGDRRRVVFDEQLLARYHQALLELKGRFGLKGSVTLEQLLALPQAMTVVEDKLPTEHLWEVMAEAVRAAVRDLVRARQREGAKLTADIRQQISTIERCTRTIKARLPKAQDEQRQRLRERLRELLGREASGTSSQLEEALALVRDADIHEELVRLASHLTQMRQALQSRQPVGKQLDFMAQELMREANTTGAKVNDPQAAQQVFEIKGSIEKIREQVQNLE